MHLLNVYTRQLQEFIGDRTPPYAILSHTWGEHEVLFQDLTTPRHKEKLGYKKIEGCCRQAILDGFKFVWIDTCCIDKRSSAELSEAINSMFRWYCDAKVCYVYLVDVSWEEDSKESHSAFRNSRWFTRGWTLQELIAPLHLKFFDTTWSMMFSIDKDSSGIFFYDTEIYVNMIQEITGILEWRNYGSTRFDRKSRLDIPVAIRLSWVSKRHTTRVEDMAYCLLGLLDINMPLLYGEGHKAFLRLQEEFLKKHHDSTILYWGFDMGFSETCKIRGTLDDGCLAPTPLLFRGFLGVRNGSFGKDYRIESTAQMGWTVTPRGLHIQLPILRVDPQNNVYLGMTNHLAFRLADLVIPLYKVVGSDVYNRTPTCVPFSLRQTARPFNFIKLKGRLKEMYIGSASPNDGGIKCFGPVIDLAALREAGFVLDSVYPPTEILDSDRVRCPNKIPHFTSTRIIIVMHREQVNTLYIRVTCSKPLSRKPSDETWQNPYKTTISSVLYEDKRSAIEVWDAGRRAWERIFRNPPQLDWQETTTIRYKSRVERVSSKWKSIKWWVDGGLQRSCAIEVKAVYGNEIRSATDEG
ncbi:HET-domain-containing protein [Xylaria scruposa]|nr:HET-domain-containing protein [Xylaria scruposa]